MTARDLGDIAGLQRMADGYAIEVARQRGRLRTAWRTATQDVDRLAARIRAADYTLGRRDQTFNGAAQEGRGSRQVPELTG